MVAIYTGILALIIVRTLRRDIARYNRDEEFVSFVISIFLNVFVYFIMYFVFLYYFMNISCKFVYLLSISVNIYHNSSLLLLYFSQDDALEETGWKLVHGDVFRPPQHPMLLVACIGSGLQLLCMVLVIIGTSCTKIGCIIFYKKDVWQSLK